MVGIARTVGVLAEQEKVVPIVENIVAATEVSDDFIQLFLLKLNTEISVLLATIQGDGDSSTHIRICPEESELGCHILNRYVGTCLVVSV